ncbi:MAG: hypothetical protein IT442_07120 [Phycisphaeraceae bacterium]|nr:hypothetical protein [Phycisphaeraceae bacterium]
MPPVNVICMKWGTAYSPDHVNRLRAAVARHLHRPHRFVCFTDDPAGIDPRVETHPLPSLDLPPGHDDLRWRQLAIFAPTLADLTGPSLFLDLDLLVIADLDPFFDLPGPFRVIRDDELFPPKLHHRLRPRRYHYLPDVGNTSVFRFEVGRHADILDAYLADPAAATSRYRISQQFKSAQLAARGHLQFWPRHWCVSFKYQCVPPYGSSYFLPTRPPRDARIVIFAAHPKLEEVLAGQGQTWYRRIHGIDWLRRAYELDSNA